MKPSQRHQRDADLIREFREAYVRLLNQARREPRGYMMSEFVPKVGDQDWSRLYSETAQAAGAGVMAYERHGGSMTLHNAARVMSNVNIVLNWELSLRDPEQLEPIRLIACVEAAVARAHQEAQDATEREKGLTGLIAAFLRWPSTLREAAGPGRAQRGAAGAIGVVGQILVGITASLFAAGLLAVGVAVWQSVL